MVNNLTNEIFISTKNWMDRYFNDVEGMGLLSQHQSRSYR